MRVFKTPTLLLATTLLAGGLAFQANAADATATSGTNFQSSDLLVSTLMRDDQSELDSARSALDAAQSAEEAAQAALDAATTDEAIAKAKADLEAATQARIQAQDALTQEQTDFNAEQQLVEMQVSELSTDQLTALNRALNNSLHDGFVPALGSDQLAMVLDGNYDAKDINALTKAYEEEAKFDSFADRFEAKAESTGNDKFLEQAQRMRDRAVSQRDKFLAKITPDTVTPDDDASPDIDADATADASVNAQADVETGQAAREAAKETADQARQDAKETASLARENAKSAAQDARSTARDAAQEARATARDAAQEARATARDAAQTARETARDAAQTAREAAKEASQNAREVAREAAQTARETARDAVRGL